MGWTLRVLHEALGFGVVVRIARPAHAALEAALVQTSRVFVGGVLHAAIGMVDEALRRISRGDRHVESLDGQTGFQVIVERPSHDLAREGVDDDGEVDEGFGESDIGYVGDPELIEAGRFEPTR
jgi:hypothetical protein